MPGAVDNSGPAALNSGNRALLVSSRHARRQQRPVSLPDHLLVTVTPPANEEPRNCVSSSDAEQDISAPPTRPRASRRPSPAGTVPCTCPCCQAAGARRLRNENFLVLSVIQMLCALAAVTLSCVAITQQVFKYELGAGLWAGSLMLTAGVHGIVTSRRKTPCTLVALLVLCVLAAVTAGFLTCLSAAGLVMDSIRKVHTQHLVLHALLLIVGFLETTIAVATSVLCCKQVCCGGLQMPQMLTASREALAGQTASYCPGITPLSTGCYLLHTGSQGGTLLYLMPTPTGEEVPMLFSPPSTNMPPAYSTLPRDGCQSGSAPLDTDSPPPTYHTLEMTSAVDHENC